MYFIKNNKTNNPQALMLEVDGLEALRQFTADLDISIPKVIDVNESQLTIEKIDSIQCSDEQSALLGEQLALMHKKQSPQYGYTKDNMIGLNPQKNIMTHNWGEFFYQYRLAFQVSLIQDSAIKREFEKVLNQRKENLINYLNETTTHPSLVHGDLWSGNYLCDSEKVYLIDPAVYFGDREVDLAMSEMFGGFSPAFYQAYDTAYPRSADYPHKKKIYNLYHYLNHYNLFGQSYLGPCRELFEIL